MLLYNVTVGVDREVESEWLQWMRTEHIPAVLKTGMFVSHKLYKILGDDDEPTSSYSIQYFAKSIDQVNHYLEVYAPALIESHRQRFHDRHVAFRTLLQEL